MSCTNNLKQTGLALHLYHDTYSIFPIGCDYIASTGWAWSAFVLPFMENENIGQLIEFTNADGTMRQYGDQLNADVLRMFVMTYQCPSAPPLTLSTCCRGIRASNGYSDIEDAAQTDYGGVVTDLRAESAIRTEYANPYVTWYYDNNQPKEGSGVLYSNSAVRIADIHDGSSQTLMVGERIPYPDDDPWKQSAGPDYCPGGVCEMGEHWAAKSAVTTGYGINNPNARFYLQSAVQSAHPGGANFAFADGHVSFLSEGILQDTLRSMTTRNSLSADGITQDVIVTVD